MSRFEEIADTLKKRDFIAVSSQDPDPKHFGNWILIGGRLHSIVRVTHDRGNTLLDLMPIHQFRTPTAESDWFNWDVVIQALGIPTTPEQDPMRSYLEHFYVVDSAFAPEHWERTKSLLSDASEARRHSFRKGQQISSGS